MSFTYVIFGFKSIIDDRHIAIECAGSHLWEYVVCLLICSICDISRMLSYLSSEILPNVFEVSTSNQIAIFMLKLISSTWGSVELWHNSCNNLTHTVFYKIGLISVICDYILITITIVRCLITLLLNWILRETDGDADIEISNDKISTNV